MWGVSLGAREAHWRGLEGSRGGSLPLSPPDLDIRLLQPCSVGGGGPVHSVSVLHPQYRQGQSPWFPPEGGCLPAGLWSKRPAVGLPQGLCLARQAPPFKAVQYLHPWGWSHEDKPGSQGRWGPVQRPRGPLPQPQGLPSPTGTLSTKKAEWADGGLDKRVMAKAESWAGGPTLTGLPWLGRVPSLKFTSSGRLAAPLLVVPAARLFWLLRQHTCSPCYQTRSPTCSQTPLWGPPSGGAF